MQTAIAKQMTVREAALRLGVTDQTIRNWLREGRLLQVPVLGRALMVETQSVERRLAELERERTPAGGAS